MPMRTFLAIDVDEPIRSAMFQAARQLEDCGAIFRAVGVENLHVTLQFLGDVTDDVLGKVCDIAAEVAASVEPFDFDIRGLLAVPSHGQLRMVWAGIRDGSGRMKQLAESLADGLAGLPVRQEERDFRPHITLGRIKHSANPARFRQVVAELADTDFGLQHADELTAYTSQLTPTGPIYTPLTRAPLGK